MPLLGVNKLCAQCINECKQWAQIKVIICPFFRSKQEGLPKNKRPNPASVEECQKAILEP